MFKPVRMERILVGGHRDRMESVIQTLQEQGVLHLEDYADESGITQMGDPLEAGDRASDVLVRVRGLQKAIDAEDVPAKDLPVPDDVAPLVDEAEEAITPIVRKEQEMRAKLAELHNQRTSLAPFIGLDIDLDAMTGLESVRAITGFVSADPTSTLQAAGIDAEVATNRTAAGLLAVIVVRADAANDAERALTAIGFQAVGVPEGKGTPATYLKHLDQDIARLAADAQTESDRLHALAATWSGRLAALERILEEEVARTQLPLRFAVTDNTFHIEGWVPRDRVNALENTLAHDYSDALYMERLGDAPRGHDDVAHGDEGHHHHDHEGHDHGDDHHEVAIEDEAPTALQNGKVAGKYEFLLGLLAMPRYRELDPTKLIAIFFPLFFGLMVGDVVIGLLIVGVALWLRNNRLFGIGGDGIAKPMMWGGIMAIVIGLFVFGEGLGLHFVVSDEAIAEGEHSWETAFGIHFPEDGFLHKEVSAHHGDAMDAHGEVTDSHAAAGTGDAVTLHAEEAAGATSILASHGTTHLKAGPVQLGYYSKVHDVQALLIWSILIGVVHVVLGLVLGVRNVYIGHGLKLAVQEKVSWLLIMAGLGVLAAGFVGGDSVLTYAGAGSLLLGVVLLWFGVAHTLGDGNLAMGFIAILEVPSLIGNLLSYTRLAAIGASKAGMAIAFATIGFELIGGPAGLVVYLLAALLITLLAILAGFLQSLRLQFVEFFSKFYEGGGRSYVPFARRAAQPPSSP